MWTVGACITVPQALARILRSSLTAAVAYYVVVGSAGLPARVFLISLVLPEIRTVLIRHEW
jgi:hypothetical protein